MHRRYSHDGPLSWASLRLALIALIALCAGGGGGGGGPSPLGHPSRRSFWPLMTAVVAAEEAAGTLLARRSIAEADNNNNNRDSNDEYTNSNGGGGRALPAVALSLLRSQTPFSEGWMKGLVTDEAGCSDWRTVGYAWVEDGAFVSNVNS